MGWVLVGLVGFSGIACSDLMQAESESAAEVAVPAPVVPPNQVVALGRLVPQGEVIQLSVPNAADSRVNQVLVQEGDRVQPGQIIAILQGFERRQRDLEEAQKTVEFYQARLNQIRLGDAKQAELAAQAANIARLEAQMQNEILEREAAINSAEAALRQAESTYDRNASLAGAGAISAQVLDQSRESLERAQATLEERQAQLSTTTETLKKQIDQERQTLAQLQEVRPVDVRVAQVELERAQIAVEQRRADLEDTRVRAPVAGQVLRINTQVGEQVNIEEGIVELGQTDQMVAIAEVYETEITRVKVGQPAMLASEYGGFDGTVRGQVEHISLQVGQRSLSAGSTNPTTDENQRVVEVRIQIHPEDNAKVANLTNMQVRVHIDTAS
jgi:HlyD family secretion protein